LKVKTAGEDEEIQFCEASFKNASKKIADETDKQITRRSLKCEYLVFFCDEYKKL